MATQPLSISEALETSDVTYYFPRHAVMHPTKKKTRVIFDAAAVYKGVSLNSELCPGSDLMNNLIGVLLRFHEHWVAIVADIQKMFYQVKMPLSDKASCASFGGRMETCTRKRANSRMCKDIFGVSDSPSCASFALRKTANDNAADQ